MNTATDRPTSRILVVDDDEPTRLLHSEILRREGFDTITADCGEEALRVLGSERVDLVLLDHWMPGISGLDVIRRIRERDDLRTLPVILVTGDLEPGHDVRGLETGADDYVTKPVHLPQLVARVRAHLRGQTAWSDALDRLRQRAAVVGVLSRVRTEGEPEQIAAAVCDEVAELGWFDGCAVAAVFGHQSVRVLYGQGQLAPLLPDGEVVGPTASLLRDWALAPPGLTWGRGLRAAWRGTDLGDLVLATAPLEADHEPFGVLVVSGAGIEDDHSEGARLLSTAIDLAGVAAALLAPSLRSEARLEEARSVLREIIDTRAFEPYYQPVIDLADGSTVGFEALTRWDDGLRPDLRFAEAHRVGLGAEVERATLERALRLAAPLPAEVFLGLNVSAGILMGDDGVADLLRDAGRSIVVEITEHEPVEDYEKLLEVVASLGEHASLAVDDAGAGYASLRHILALRPQHVKLDRSWVAGIDADRARQALVAGLVHFARETGYELLAEGVETEAERDVLVGLGVRLAQGFLFGRPAPVSVWVT